MQRPSLLLLAIFALLTACTPYMYGVPQEQWERMNQQERLAAMQVYEREQQAERRAAEERARRVEAERQRQAALERERQERIEAIHRGDGAYGELLRVRLEKGRVKMDGHPRRFEPLSFTIAAGENRSISVRDAKGRERHFSVSYSGGALVIDGRRIPYDRHWSRGERYADLDTAGALPLQDLELFVAIHDRSSRHDRRELQLVLLREEPPKPAPAPPKPPVTPPAPVVEQAPALLEVSILGGELKQRGERREPERSSFRLQNGESRQVTVRAGEAVQTIAVSYRDGELAIDPTPGRGNDTARLPFAREWRQGQVYRLTLKGGGALQELELKVTGMEKK